MSQHKAGTTAAKLSGLPCVSAAQSKTANPLRPRNTHSDRHTHALLHSRGRLSACCRRRAPPGRALLHDEQLLLILPRLGLWQSCPNLQPASCVALPRRPAIAATLSPLQKEVGVCGLLRELLPPNAEHSGMKSASAVRCAVCGLLPIMSSSFFF